jgi:hypothetical protein
MHGWRVCIVARLAVEPQVSYFSLLASKELGNPGLYSAGICLVLIDKGEARQHVADLLNVGRSTLYRAPNS